GPPECPPWHGRIDVLARRYAHMPRIATGKWPNICGFGLFFTDRASQAVLGCNTSANRGLIAVSVETVLVAALEPLRVRHGFLVAQLQSCRRSVVEYAFGRRLDGSLQPTGGSGGLQPQCPPGVPVEVDRGQLQCAAHVLVRTRCPGQEAGAVGRDP